MSDIERFQRFAEGLSDEEIEILLLAIDHEKQLRRMAATAERVREGSSRHD